MKYNIDFLGPVRPPTVTESAVIRAAVKGQEGADELPAMIFGDDA